MVGTGARRGSSGVRTTGMERKRGGNGESAGALLIALSLLMPPLGLLLTWRSRRATMAVRVIASASALAVMVIFFAVRAGGPEATSIKPAPSIPTTIGYGNASPASNVAPAQAAAQADPAAGNTVVVAPPNESGAKAVESGQEALPTDAPAEGYVYAVTNNASVYHASEVCDGQANRRALSLEQAVSEGLAPCEKCYAGG